MNRNRFLGVLFAAMIFALSGGYYHVSAQQQADESTIRQMVQTMEDGWNKKSGKAFATHFAEEHDYINIWGLYLPKASRDGNAWAHQELFDGPYKEIDLQLRVSKFRFLSPEIVIVHILGHTYAKGKVEDKRQEMVISGVVQRRAGKWEIVAFQNTPIQPRQEKPAGK